MFKNWVCRILALVFLTEVVVPLPGSAQSVGMWKLPSSSSDFSFQTVAQNIQRATSFTDFVENFDEYIRSQDTARQTDLAREIVKRHHSQTPSGGDRRVFEAHKAAQGAVNQQRRMEQRANENLHRTGLYTMEPYIDANGFIDTASVMKAYANRFKSKEQIYEDAYAETLLGPLQERINSEDFTLDEMLDYLDPYGRGDYDPMLTTLAAQTMSRWLMEINTVYKSNKEYVAGIAIYSTETEQRVLYRLAHLLRQSPESRDVKQITAIQSLRILLWHLYVFRHDTLAQFKDDLVPAYGNDSIFVDHKINVWDRTIGKSLEEIEKMGNAFASLEASSPQYEALQALVVYTAMLAILEDKSGLLISSYGQSLAPSAWTSMDRLFLTLDYLDVGKKRFINEIPFGPYFQNSAVLLSALGSFLEEQLTDQDLAGASGTQFIQMLKEYAAINTRNSTPTVVTVAKLASYLHKKKKVILSDEDKAVFAKAVESVYCRSSVNDQDYLYDSNGVKQDLGTSIDGYPNMGRIRFADFGFSDVKQHAEFMRALAETHKNLDAPTTILKKINRNHDAMVQFTKDRKEQPQRRFVQLPSGDFYYKCTFDTKYKRSSVLDTRQAGKIFVAVFWEIILWMAFDGALRVVGKIVSSFYRVTKVSVETLPKALRAARKASSQGRRMGAFGKEFRNAYKASKQMNTILKNGGSITAHTTETIAEGAKAAKKGKKITDTRRLLSGPGVNEEKALDAALEAERAANPVNQGVRVTSRPWKSWHSPTNRSFWGLGPKRGPITEFTLRQGSRTVTISAEEIGLENGIRTMRDWKKLFNAAKKQGFEFVKLEGSALRAAKEAAYMADVAALRMTESVLGKYFPWFKQTAFGRYAGAGQGWVSISLEEFTMLQRELQKGVTEVHDFYALLKIPRNATTAEIEMAWKEALRKAHPDRMGNNELIHTIQQAYKTLTDPLERRAYDYLLNAARPGAGGKLIIPVSEEGLSLGIALKGGKTFRAGEGMIGFGKEAGNAFGDVIPSIVRHMEETGRYYSQTSRMVAGWPQFFQGNWHSITKTLPVMASFDWLLEDPFKKWMANTTAEEMKKVTLPFETHLKKLSEKDSKQEQPEPSIYQRVSAIEPLVINSFGLPTLRFFGSSLGFATFSLYKALGGVIIGAGVFMSRLFGESSVDPRVSLPETLRYQLASKELGDIVSERLNRDLKENILKPYRTQRETMLKEAKQYLSEEGAAAAGRIWDDAIAEIGALTDNEELMKDEEEFERQRKKIEERLEESIKRITSVTGIIAQWKSMQKEVKQTLGEEAAAVVQGVLDQTLPKLEALIKNEKLLKNGKEFEQQRKKMENNLEDFGKRIGLLAEIVLGKEKLFATYASVVPAELMPQLKQLYNNLVRETRGIFARTQLNYDQTNTLVQKAIQRMESQTEEIFVKFAGTDRLQQLGQQPDSFLQPAQNVTDEADHVFAWYFNLASQVLLEYPDEVSMNVIELVANAKTSISQVIENTSLNEKQKRAEIATLKRTLYDQVSNTLINSDKDYRAVLEGALASIKIASYQSPAAKDVGEFATAQLALFTEWETKTANMSSKQRNESFENFLSKLIIALQKLEKKLGISLTM